MKKISLILALLLIFSLFAACNKTNDTPELTTTAAETTAAATVATTTSATVPLPEKFKPDDRVSLISSTRAVRPLGGFDSSLIYMEQSDSWVAGDGFAMSDLCKKDMTVHFPRLTVGDDLSVNITDSRGKYMGSVLLFDEELDHIGNYFLRELPSILESGKTYYVFFTVEWQGRYIESHSKYETTRYLYACALEK
ncbi:MAG: hypothetical protein E7641_02930 [Ruminococcaceae bacterium]|nr:hypothetical protein [Oscillospiraceae bacterium]